MIFHVPNKYSVDFLLIIYKNNYNKTYIFKSINNILYTNILNKRKTIIDDYISVINIFKNSDNLNKMII